MAKKNNLKQNNNIGPSKWELLKSFFTPERSRFIFGLILLAFTIYLTFALISFFFTGAADQSKIENLATSEMLSIHRSVENWCGVRGACLSDLLMNRWFGVSSLMIPYFLGSVSLVLMKIKRINLLNRFIFSTAVLVWASWSFAFFFIKGYEDTFLYLGGQHGYYIVEALKDNLGISGTFLFLLTFFLIIAIFSSKKTIPFLQRLFDFGWLHKIRIPRFGKEKTADSDENIEEKGSEFEEKYIEIPTEDENEEKPVIPLLIDDEFDTEKELQEVENQTKPSSVIIEDNVNNAPEVRANPLAAETVNEPEMFVPILENSEGSDLKIEIAPDEEEDYNGSALGNYDPRLDLSRYVFPNINLLEAYDQGKIEINEDDLKNNQQLIKRALEDFGIKIASIKATVGPTVTLYEIIPEPGIRIARIKTLEDDIALKLAALQIRIIAPIPGKGTIGIEVPNKNPQTVSMRSVIASKKFQECTYDLPVAMGKTITNEICMFDLAKAPHLLVAGATGQGKSVGLNAIITSLLYKKHPAELKFVMVDPKMVEFSLYSKIEKHYLAKLPNIDNPIVTEPLDAVATLNSLVIEMENRYKLLVSANVRNIKEYNAKFINRQLNPNKGHHFLPYIVAIVDEFADLIATSGKEIETPIARIAAKARAIGIHMILATQRPDTKVVTGTIKSNFPSRIAFKVAAMVDSRTILDAPGANRLIGRGDMLLAIAGKEMLRVQCAFVDTPEVENIVDYISQQVAYPTAYMLPDYVPENDGDKSSQSSMELGERDPLFEEAARLIVLQQQGSTSLIQRKFAIGYNRAGRLMDQLEAAGIVGPSEGSKARQVLMPDEYSLEQLLNNLK